MQGGLIVPLSNCRSCLFVIFSILLNACGGGGSEPSASKPTASTDLFLSSSLIAFNFEKKGAQPITQSVTASWKNPNVAAVLLGYPPGTTPPSWLNISTQDVGSPLDISLTVHPISIEPGVYTVTVRVVSVDVNAKPIDTVDINVNLNLYSKLAISGNTTIDFNMFNTGIPPRNQSITLAGANVNWVATASKGWLQLGNTSGTTPGSVSLGVDTSSFTIGVYTANIVFTDTLNNDTVTLAVELRIDPHRLVVDDNGFAFSSMPTLSKLSSTVVVNDNANISAPWAASSSKTWLSVTASGVGGDSLLLTADPTGLTMDTIHYAIVNLTSSDTTIENTETIQIGLWVGSADPIANDSLVVRYNKMSADPVRPYVYMHNNGASASIDVYNIYTSALVSSIPNVATQLGDMDISSDGSTLFVIDRSKSAIVAIDLNTMTPGAAWNMVGTKVDWLAYGRVDNQSIVFVSNGTVYNADTGKALSDRFTIDSSFEGYGTGLVLDVNQTGKVLCGATAGLMPYRLGCLSLRYSDQGAGNLTMINLASVSGPGGTARDIALTQDGTGVYVASQASQNFTGFDTNTLLPRQSLAVSRFTTCLETSSDNLLYGSGAKGLYGSNPADAWIYDTNGVLQKSYKLSADINAIYCSELVVSGDGLRMIVVATNSSFSGIKMVTTR